MLRPTIRDVGQNIKETVINFFTKNSDELAEGAETADDARKLLTGQEVADDFVKELDDITNSGSGGRTKPYYRISTSRKGALSKDGVPSSDKGLTHIDIDTNSVDDIKKIIDNFLSGGK